MEFPGSGVVSGDAERPLPAAPPLLTPGAIPSRRSTSAEGACGCHPPTWVYRGALGLLG